MTKHLIAFLAFIGFRKAINEYALSHKSGGYKEHLVYAFSDSNGRRYFRFDNMKNMPLALLEKLNELQDQMTCKMPSKDLDRWVECVENVLNNDKNKNKVTDFGYWLGQLKERRTVLFEPTVLTEIAALLYIREDENPCFYNSDLHKEKFEMIWKDSREGGLLYDFFQQSGLSAYIPSGTITKENWSQYLEDTMKKVNTFGLLLSRNLASRQEIERLAQSSEQT
jgi:hypothetical protein